MLTRLPRRARARTRLSPDGRARAVPRRAKGPATERSRAQLSVAQRTLWDGEAREEGEMGCHGSLCIALYILEAGVLHRRCFSFCNSRSVHRSFSPLSFPRTHVRDLTSATAACQLRMSLPDCSYILSIWRSYLPWIAKTSYVARPQPRQLAKEPSICGCVSIACNCR